MKTFFWPAYAIVASLLILVLLFRAENEKVAECRSEASSVSTRGLQPQAKKGATVRLASAQLHEGFASAFSSPERDHGFSQKQHSTNDAESAEARVRGIERLVALTPEQRRRLLEFYEKENALFLANERGEVGDGAELPSEEQILGPETTALLAQREDAESKAVLHLEERKETVYLTQLLGLTEEQQQKLHSSFESEDRFKEIDVAYALSELNIPGERRAVVEKLLRSDFDDEVQGFVESAGGVDQLPENLVYSPDGSVRRPDEAAIADQLRRDELKKVLTEEQMNRYLQLEEEGRPVN